MTKYLIGLLLFCISTNHLNAQEQFEVSIPETYELSNIILALMDYGRTDEWQVQKHTAYYNDVIKYFEPINYSRALMKNNLPVFQAIAPFGKISKNYVAQIEYIRSRSMICPRL